MAFNKKMLPVTIALLLMSSTSYGAYGDYGIELEDNEVCYLAKYTLEKSIKTIDTSYNEFKTAQLEKCKNNREVKRVESKLKIIENKIARKKMYFEDILNGANRCIDGNSGDCSYWGGSCRQRHASSYVHPQYPTMGESPLLVIEKVSFDLDAGRVKFQDAPQMVDIEIVMEAFEAAEKEKQLAEEKRAREKEARKIARERQQAEKDFLAAQKNLEEQKILDAKNEKLRAEAEELNRLRAQAQAEKAELEKLEAARAELAALKEQLEAAKIQAATEAQNKAAHEAIQREREEVERQHESIRLQKQKEEDARQAQAMKEAEEKAKQELANEAKREAERQKFAMTNKVISGCQKIFTAAGMSHAFYSNQAKYGTSAQKKEAEEVLSYTNEIIEILDETVKLCNKGKETGDVAPCESKGVENLNKASFRMMELNKVLDEISRKR